MIDEECVPGPRIYPSGAMISQTPGHGDFRQRAEIPRHSGNDLSIAEVAGISAIADGEAEVRRMADAGAWWSIQPFLADEDANVYASQAQREQQQMIADGTKRAFDLGPKYGVKMAWGTDILFNPKGTATQDRQLAKMARWFDTAHVLKMAISINAQLLALSGNRNPYAASLGVLEAGAMADMLLIEGNPLEDISLIADPGKNMKLIIKNGHIHKNTLTA